jgi:hypothetical protein
LGGIDGRYEWTFAVIAVCDSAEDDVLFDLFNGLKSKIPEDMRIKLPNCPAVHEISVAAAAREISKLQTIDYFRKMLQSTSSSRDAETIQELKKVLSPDVVATGTLAVVQDFIRRSSLDFQISLLHRLEEVNSPGSCLTKVIISDGEYG